MRVLLLCVSMALLAACASTVNNRDPGGEVFPSVRGASLDGQERRLPEDVAGRPVVLLLGYVMETQFDIDRWLIGLAQVEVPVAVIEVPTIAGMFPGLFAGFIDSGMRSGIPAEDWGGVVTLYGSDAGKVVELTGNQVPRNGRVLLLDAQGRIAWFHDRGFSPGKLLQLEREARQLAAPAK